MIPDAERIAQFHANQCIWVSRLATGEVKPHPSHNRLHHSGESMAVRTGDNGVIMLGLQPTSDTLAEHNQLLHWFRESRLGDVLVWSMYPHTEIDLHLLAQGYQTGFEPWWMTRDLTGPLPSPAHDIHVATDHDIDRLAASDVPYIVPEQLETTRRLSGDVVWLIASDNGEIMGQAIVNLTGTHAGLFNVGVSGRRRRRGIGSSLTAAAMRMAQAAGATTMNLNSTLAGLHVYERAGFRRIGNGQTWHVPKQRSRSAPPETQQQTLIAIGRGDLAALASLPLQDQFANGMTAQEVGAHFRQPESLRWLLQAGQIPEIMPLWRAGLRVEALAATQDRDARELRSGQRRATPLHLAVEAGAGTLVLALIEAGADLTVRDGEYRATPLDWAHACNKPTIARILRQAGAS